MNIFEKNIKSKLIGKIIIPFELMDLNTFIDKQRINRFLGNKAKQDETQKCSWIIKSYINKGLVVNEDDLPIDIVFIWHSKNRMKDKDNISFAKKFILDGMVQSKLLENDGWKQLGSFSDYFEVDKLNPRVEVYIYKRLDS